MTKSHSNLQSSVLVLAGLDPTGGAGICADIETLSNLKVHALPIITCLTVQDSHNVKQLTSIEPRILKNQLETLQQDIPFQAIKLGLLSSIEIINLLADTLKAQPNVPVVFDPILRAGGGADLARENIDSIIQAMREKIIPLTTIITPNSIEARLLTGKDNLTDCAEVFAELGCKNILITGEHENNPDSITNTLYSIRSSDKLTHSEYCWPRLPHKYHGSGCTLASAISGYIAKGFLIADAVQQAQDFTHSALQQAVQLGKSQYHPDRFCHNLKTGKP